MLAIVGLCLPLASRWETMFRRTGCALHMLCSLFSFIPWTNPANTNNIRLGATCTFMLGCLIGSPCRPMTLVFGPYRLKSLWANKSNSSRVNLNSVVRNQLLIWLCILLIKLEGCRICYMLEVVHTCSLCTCTCHACPCSWLRDFWFTHFYPPSFTAFSVT